MKIETIKDLDKLMQLCRKRGISAIEVDNIKFNLGVEPVAQKQPQYSPQPQMPTYSPGGITPDTTDGLTEDQLLFYSVSETQDQLS